MYIIRITEGEHITNIEGSWTVFTDTFEASAGQFSHFTAADGTNLGTPDEAPKVSDNAFIPIITPINYEEDLFHSYEIVVNEKEYWTFDSHISESLRKQKSHEVKFKNSSYGARVKFKVEKGNPTANDTDGGNIKAWFFSDTDSDSDKSESDKYEIISDIKYGDTFFINWDTSKGIFQVQFYADDNDLFFDGGIENIYCGAAKIRKSRIRKIWEAYPKKNKISREDLYSEVGGYLKTWYDEVKSLPKTDPKYTSLDNTCALRMSRALNYSNNPIPEINDKGYKTFKGGDNKNYFITVANIRRYLLEFITKEPEKVDRQSENEVIFIESECGWTDATGHVDIMVDRNYGSDYHLECQNVIGWTNID